MSQVDTSPEVMALAGRLTNMLERVMAGETTVKAELDLMPEELETMYAVAYNQYANKKYQEALQAFTLLLFFDPTEYKYLLGAAGCLQMNGQYEMASVSYIYAAAVHQSAPAPFLYLAECLLKLKDKEGALDALKKAVALSGEAPDWASFRNRAEAMLENLNS